MNSDKKPLVVLTGPTAAGKTALSIALAHAINGQIISADSMQVYREMNIGTAKIRPDEMNGIKHYLVDEISPLDPFNVVIFQQKAKAAMEEIYASGHIPIIVGGTGFYIQAILRDIDFTENDDDHSYRKSLEEKAAQINGPQALYEELKIKDPESADKIHPNNTKKVIRALEFYQQTGSRISQHNEQESLKKSPYNFAYFVLDRPRDLLYKKIEERIDRMMEEGLLDEVRSLREKGYTRDLVSMQGLGYKELLSCLEGEISLEEAIYILKRDTRHFAKRQLTWFRRESDVIWVEKDDFASEEAILEFMKNILIEKGII